MSQKIPGAQPFGTLLGVAPGGVPAYSSDYKTVPEADYPSRKSFRSHYDGIYMGYKWQCVEFARRWLYMNFRLIFDDVAMAYDIFDLRTVRDTRRNRLLPLHAFANGSKRRPEFGSLLIWQEGGEFEETGHVAVVTEVTDSYVRVAEQNVSHVPWEGRNFSRELTAKVGEGGDYWVTCSYGDAQILGWMIQTEDSRFAEPVRQQNPELRMVKAARISEGGSFNSAWLNIANSDEEAYVKAMGGHCLTQNPLRKDLYYRISNNALDQLETATNELHGMFLHATDFVLDHEHLLQRFNLPPSILPRIKQSWDNRLNEVITSRFDFALTPDGLKVYEYNCDSASCYMETAKVQGKWGRHFQVTDGVDGGKDLFKLLVRAWKRSKAEGIVHILRDNDPEEIYHSLFMKQAIEAAGLRCRIIDCIDHLVRDEAGRILDPEAQEVRWVWKTWAWETALDQLRERDATTPDGLELADVLFKPDIMVFEPLWSLIPSNKAILPVLWNLFPNHPLLLNTSFELTEDLRASGYVRKPIVGRCGSNITLVDHANTQLSRTEGAFADQDVIYQQYFPLPKVAGLHVQLCTFTAAGLFAGTGVRVDEDLVINKDSDCLALRVVDDTQFLGS